MEPVEKVMGDSGFKKTEIAEVVLVGGSTRIPKVQLLIKDYFNGKEPNKGINPDEAVAYGAAVQGGILGGENSEQTKDLSGIPPAPRGTPQIEVTFDVDENSILTVSAVEKATGNQRRLLLLMIQVDLVKKKLKKC